MSRRLVALVAAGFTVAVGALVLVGWFFRLEPLMAPVVPEPIIKANTALALVLLGAALWIAAFDPARAPKPVILGLSALVMLIGLATAVEYLAGVSFGIDNFFVRDYHPRGPLNPFPGRMAFGSALCFASLGAAVLAHQVTSLRWRQVGDLCAVGAGWVTVLGFVSSLYGVPPDEPLTIVAYRPAWATGFALLAAVIGVLVSGEKPWLYDFFAGDDWIPALARRLLPVAVAVPVAVGLVVRQWTGAGMVGAEFGDALVTVGAAFLLGLVVVVATARAKSLDTSRMDAMARAAASDYQYRIAIEAAPAGMLMVDARGTITFVNRRVTDIFGYGADELVGQVVEILLPDALRGTHVGERNGLEKQASAHRVMGAGREFRARRKDGTEITVEIGLSPIAIGTSRMVLTAVVDVTQRKRLEAQFRQAQKMEAVGRLAGGVAHDFNNILTAILGHADFLADEVRPGTSAAEDLDGIKTAARRAADLTRQLLTFSRQQMLEPKVFPLSEAVVNAEKMLRRIIGEDIELVTHLAPDTASVLADPGQIGQVLMNLVVNARDAMPGGGRLTIETGTVELDASRTSVHGDVTPGRYAMLAVADSGTGMDEGTKARLFEPFFTTKEVGKGTGLGLATVYGIVKQSGGHIWVYSEPGQGSVFKVHLPVAVAGAPDAVRESPVVPARGGTETVLVVEDDASVRAIAVGALRRRGYRVLEAAAPDEALRLVDKEAGGVIHALVTDVVMPGMSGLALARMLQRPSPEIRLLFTSGYTPESAALQGLIETGLTFLQKPYTVEAIGRRVREVLDASPVRLPEA